MEFLSGSLAKVARALLEKGPATVSELSDELGLTGAAVRKHLDELVESGLVTSSERPPFGPLRRPRRRGRPARFFHLTPEGRERFERDYDHLAIGALRFMAESGGSDMVMAFARKRVSELEEQFADLMHPTQSLADRVDVLADALAAEGYAAVVVPNETGVQICQHNCPVAHVAAQFPQLCEAETEAFGRLLGTHVMRLATLAHGDGVCTTHIPTGRYSNDPNPAAVDGRTSR